MFKTPINIAIFTYIISTTLIVVLKPKFFFNGEGEPIPFGCGSDETLFPFYVVTIVFSIFVYVISMLLF